MVFEYRHLKLSEPRPIKSPLHPINRRVIPNWLQNKLIYSPLERVLLGVKHRDLEIYERTYQSPIVTDYHENNIGRIRYYKASENQAVIVLPQRGSGFDNPNRSSGYNIAQLISSYLATNGISAYEFETPFNGSRRTKVARDLDLNILKSTFNQAITEVISLVELIEERKIGICGVSLGGIYGSIAYTINERLSSACLIMGGGNIADMIFDPQPKDRLIGQLRGYVLKNGILRETLRSELKEIEPCNYTRPSKSPKLLMINAARDRDVPEEYGEELRKAWEDGFGNPQYRLINTGHLDLRLMKEAFILLPMILDHFRRTLGDLP